MIDPADWQRLSALLDEALALEGDARRAWLQALATREPALAERVERALSAATARAARDAAGTWLRPALAEAAGKVARADAVFGAWRLVAPLGRGGMGEVWLARRVDGLYEAEAAIKLLRGDLSPERLAGRFARERAVLARLNHPGIARMLDAGMHEGQAFIVLEHVQGVALDAYARAHAPLLAQRVRLLLQVAEAVEHAHALLVVHRDLKPANVLVTPQGHSKLLDFGIAALLDDEGPAGELTRQAGRALTPGYAAPEQIAGLPVAAAADVFALGVMLYELIDGKLPFSGRKATRAAVEHAVLHDEPRRLGSGMADEAGPGRPADARRARGDLEAIAAKALRKEPAARYASVRALIDDLQRWLDHRPVLARRDDWRHRSRLFVRRHALLVAAAAGVTVALAAGLAATGWQWWRAEAAARRSEAVTGYLADMIESVGPGTRRGRLATVTDLLDESAAQLPARFAADPLTRLRMLKVLTRLDLDLNRFDHGLPLAREWVDLARENHGARSREALEATIEWARGLQAHRSHDAALAELEPIVADVEREFGAQSEPLRTLHVVLAACYMHTGRLPAAERELALGHAIDEALRPGDALATMDYLNNLNVIRFRQGRLRDALAILDRTEPFWASPDPRAAAQILVLRRNQLATQIELAEYRDVELRSRTLVTDIERVLGPGNEMALLQDRMLAGYFSDIGQPRRAADEFDRLLERARGAGLSPRDHVLLRARAERQLARVRAGLDDGGVALAHGQRLLAEIDAEPRPLPSVLAEAALTVAQLALAHDDAALAGTALRVAGSDPGAGDATLGWRAAQVEGELARLRGDYAQSRAHLARRVAAYSRLAEPANVRHWSAQLDLAYTQLLMGDPQVARTLEAAAAARPRAMPDGTPLDRLAHWIQAQWQGSVTLAPMSRSASLGGAFP